MASRTSSTLSGLLPAVGLCAALDTMTAKALGGGPLLIAAARTEGKALALGLLIAVPLALLLRRAAAARAAAALAGWPLVFAAAYVRLHDVKYDLLGPFPSWPVVLAFRAGIVAGSLAIAAALAIPASRNGRGAAALATLALLAAPFAARARHEPSSPGGPAVLLCTIDTLRADHLGAYGSLHALTPHLDRLSRQGELHENAFCQIPITTPSHASILTGLSPRIHAVRGQAYSMKADVPTVVEALRRSGARTAAFVSAFPLDSRFGLDRGFETYDDELAGDPVASSLSPWRLWLIVDPAPQIERRAGDTNARVFPWLARHGRGRYFLWVHYFDPHGPYVPEAPWSRLYLDLGKEDLPSEPARDDREAAAVADVTQRPTRDVRDARLAYQAEIAATDLAFGTLVRRAAIEKPRGLTTIVLADHGESLTEHDAYFRHGEDLYDPSLRIPLIVAGPGFTASTISPAIAVTTDVAAMIARSASPEGPAADDAGSVHFAALSESTSAAVHYTPRKVYAVRTWSHKLIEGADDDSRELYDLLDDPGEAHDLSAGRGDVVAGLDPLVAAYKAGSTTPERAVDMDPETRAKLCALGYIPCE